MAKTSALADSLSVFDKLAWRAHVESQQVDHLRELLRKTRKGSKGFRQLDRNLADALELFSTYFSPALEKGFELVEKLEAAGFDPETLLRFLHRLGRFSEAEQYWEDWTIQVHRILSKLKKSNPNKSRRPRGRQPDIQCDEEILKLEESGLHSHKQIGSQFGISRSAVGHAIKRAIARKKPRVKKLR